MNRKILLGIMMIGLVATLAGAGMYAYFSDIEKSEGNIFRAGTIDLEVNGENPLVSALVTIEDMKPCETKYSGVITVKNVGTNPGSLTMHIKNVACAGGLHPESEWGEDPTNEINNIDDFIWVDVNEEYIGILGARVFPVTDGNGGTICDVEVDVIDGTMYVTYDMGLVTNGFMSFNVITTEGWVYAPGIASDPSIGTFLDKISPEGAWSREALPAGCEVIQTDGEVVFTCPLTIFGLEAGYCNIAKMGFVVSEHPYAYTAPLGLDAFDLDTYMPIALDKTVECEVSPPLPLKVGEEFSFELSFHMHESVTNWAQGDICTFTIEFLLEQV